MAPFKMTISRMVGALGIVSNLLLRLQWSHLQRLMRVNSLFSENRIVWNFSHMKEFFFHREMPVSAKQPLTFGQAGHPLPRSFAFRGETFDTAKWQRARTQTAIVVVHKGAIAYEAYYLGTSAEDQRISWSMAKSFLSAAFGIAHSEGLIPALDAPVTDYVPELAGTAYDGASIRNVLNMASGVRFNEDYLDFYSDINRMGRVLALGKSMDAFAMSLTERARGPGLRRQYVSIDTHVLGMVLRAASGRSVPDYLSDNILIPLGMEGDATYLTDGSGCAFVLGGLNMRTRDYARFGVLMAHGGRLGARQIIPAEWVRQSTRQSAPPPCAADADTDNGLLGYGYQWWLPPDAETGEFFAIGIYGQYIYVNSAQDVVIAINAGDRNFRDGNGRITLTNIAMFRAIVADLSGR